MINGFSALIQNGRLYCPEPSEHRDLLILGGQIAAIGSFCADSFRTLVPYGLVLDAEGRTVCPGIVDGHNHVNGGGGEGGFRYRVPPATLSSYIKAGVTTVVGLLGTDGFCRSLEELLAKCRSLSEEGLSTAFFTGSYQYPGPTLTGTVGRDICLIPEVIGLKIALSDHRCSHPTVQQLRALISEVRVSSLLAGKRGVVCFHMGDEESGLTPLQEALSGTGIPKTHCWPTHVGRNERLLKQAALWTKDGGLADLTAGPGAWNALETFIRNEGHLERLTLTSDGNGSMPRFTPQGELLSMGVGNSNSILATLKASWKNRLAPPEALIALATANPAQVLGLKGKGRLAPGFDGDVLILDEDMSPWAVFCRGKEMMRQKQVIVWGTYEKQENS